MTNPTLAFRFQKSRQATYAAISKELNAAKDQQAAVSVLTGAAASLHQALYEVWKISGKSEQEAALAAKAWWHGIVDTFPALASQPIPTPPANDQRPATTP